ncbi:MAG: hypothetical protein V9G63_16240 [Candidatus Competibacter sp.]|jgi:hypothetical protein|nr:hypothetical protein [Candidatus Competibacteraceae bacterium]
MRRYGQTMPGLTVPGQDAGLKLTLQPLVEAQGGAGPCVPQPTGLAWFSDATAEFSELAEAAYLLPAEPVGPVLAVARVLGETCGNVAWSSEWTPQSGTGGAPETAGVGADLLVYPATGGGPGVLSVTAECGGQTLGPILLTLLPAPSGGSCCPAPVVGSMQSVQFTDRLVYLFPIAGDNLRAETESGAIQTVWSASYTGDDPGALDLIGSALAGTLALANIDDGGHQTTITVTAELTWECDDGPHAATFAWTLEFSYH